MSFQPDGECQDFVSGMKRDWTLGTQEMVRLSDEDQNAEETFGRDDLVVEVKLSKNQDLMKKTVIDDCKTRQLICGNWERRGIAPRPNKETCVEKTHVHVEGMRRIEQVRRTQDVEMRSTQHQK